MEEFDSGENFNPAEHTKDFFERLFNLIYENAFQEFFSPPFDNYHSEIVQKGNLKTPFIVIDDDNKEIRVSENPNKYAPHVYIRDNSANQYKELIHKRETEGETERETESETESESESENEKEDIIELLTFQYHKGEPILQICHEDPENFRKIKYAIFSKYSKTPFKSRQVTQCSLILYSKRHGDSYATFYIPSFIYKKDKEIEAFYEKSRDIAYSFLKFLGIKTIIKAPGAKIELDYFKKCAVSPFLRYPYLSNILLDVNTGIELCKYNTFKKNIFDQEINDCLEKNVCSYKKGKNIYESLTKLLSNKISESNNKTKLDKDEYQRAISLYKKDQTKILLSENSKFPDSAFLWNLDKNHQVDCSYLAIWRRFGEVYSELTELLSLNSVTNVVFIDIGVGLPPMQAVYSFCNLIFFPLGNGSVFFSKQEIPECENTITYTILKTRDPNSNFANALTLATALKISSFLMIDLLPYSYKMKDIIICMLNNWNKLTLFPPPRTDRKRTEPLKLFINCHQNSDKEDLKEFIDWEDEFDCKIKDSKPDWDKIKKNPNRISMGTIAQELAAFIVMNEFADYLEISD